MRPNKAELALLRGKRDPQALTLWAEAFGKGDKKRAARLGLAIATFLGQPPPGDARTDDWNDYLGQLSPNTRKAYAAVLTEFFEWAAAMHERVVSPEDVTRLDAEEYVKWLANRPFSLAAEKLKDGDKEELRGLYEIIDEKGTASLQSIVDALPPELKVKYFGSNPTTRLENRRHLSADVRKLVTLDVVQSTPTWSVLRQSYSQAGITQWHVPLGPGGRDIPVEDVFRYQPKQYKGASRTTVAQHISALSSFWKLLAQGENVKGGEPILQYNVWEGISKRVSRGLAHEKKQASRGQKMPSDDVVKLLREAPTKSLVQLRNKAILYLMVFAGVRTTEIMQLRRGRPERGEGKAWFDGSEPPALQLIRKGGKRMRLPYPPVALKVLIEFQKMLELHAAPTFAQSSDPSDEHYVPRESVAWYYRDLQLSDAPLFPPLFLWGANSRVDYRKPLSRVQCFRLLKQMGREIGMTEEQVAKIHPHALRHFAANAMVLGGKDIREVQAILGHSSITTTEGYLEDPEGDVKLSGQEAILSFLDVKGAPVKPTYAGPGPEREVIDVLAEEVEEAVPDAASPVVTQEELEVLSSLKEDIPTHAMPESPPEYDPAVVVMAMPGQKPIVETEEGLVGIDGLSHSAERLQEDLAVTVRGGQSPGSPSWVYEAMADPKGTHETIVFNRGGQRDIEWLNENYPAMPKNFGVGHESYLPWFVKARGNLSRGGYFKGLPPFPVFSPEQCNPETSVGEAFLTRIEQAYSLLVHGDPETGRAPSPLRSVGMVRWYSFFVYHATKYEAAIAAASEDEKSHWEPWNGVVDVGNVRAHDDAYLVQWLQDNAHTFRASIDSMKRGVSRTDDDVTATFLKSSFEGIELITDVPEWMVYDDPVAALFESDPKQWGEMVLWLKNVTGQQLDVAREENRESQEATAIEEQKNKARIVRDILVSVVRLVDQLSQAKHLTRERVGELREQLRIQLYWYATAAGNVQRLRVSLDQLKELGTKEFNQAMAKEYERLGIPDPNAPEFRKLRGKKRVAAMVAKLFPDIPELSNGNVFAESKLFDPKWFRIDEKKHTVFIEDSERDELIRQFGQDPELLVRRATRAMWESRDKGHEALWGILMSYFSWIVPSGQEMASSVLGIPVADLGKESSNIQARKTWLKAWTEQMKRLAMGKELEVDADVEEADEEKEIPKKVKAAWELFLDESNKETDALERVVADGLDFAMSSSISGAWEDTPEDILMRMEELGSDDFWKNSGQPTQHFYRKNGKQSVAVLPGEKPPVFYRVDLFGRREGTLRPNAPPVLVSPGVVYRSQKRVFPARQLLPSPFRMIAAMEIE